MSSVKRKSIHPVLSPQIIYLTRNKNETLKYLNLGFIAFPRQKINLLIFMYGSQLLFITLSQL